MPEPLVTVRIDRQGNASLVGLATLPEPTRSNLVGQAT